MIGLYLLTTNILEKERTVKFGMSMRLQYRWIDYLAIFADSRYIYYYDFTDVLTKDQVFDIEKEILELHKNERNYDFQTEYFYCNNYNDFHQTITKVLDDRKINYISHNTHDFDKKNYDRANIDDDNILNEKNNQVKQCIHPRKDQELIINNSFEYFKLNSKGILVLVCGIGKTLISLWITQKLQSSKVIIGVPNILLLEQWYNQINKVFPNIPVLLIGGNNNDDFDVINKFMLDNKQFIIITTYSSSNKILSVSNELKITFDMKINDECHHLTASNIDMKTNKSYIQMLNINTTKQLSLTATLKNIECVDDNDELKLKSISNNDIDKFGKIIDTKGVKWGIDNEVVCDYVIQTIISDINDINEINNITDLHENKELFLSAYASLKSIYDKNSHHLLIYSNSKETSIKIISFIKQLLNTYFNIPSLYYSNYTSDIKESEQTNIITRYTNATYGIIACVYCLGEGFDLPKIDGVVIAENMTANIRIVQSTLRACRKNKDEPNKISKIILPIFNDDIYDKSSGLIKVKEVIYQMGLEDETIMSKLKAYKIKIKCSNYDFDNNKHNYYNDSDNKLDNCYNDDITKDLKLKTIQREKFGITYEKARKIIKDKNIQIKNKQAYYATCDKDIRLPKNPEEEFKKNIDWIHYLSIDRIYYDIDTCKEKIKFYLNKNRELNNLQLDHNKVCYELCKLDNLFPPHDLWIEYYKVKEIKDIIHFTSSIKKKGII
jgi:superfamily II DNA or RNA helicase